MLEHNLSQRFGLLSNDNIDIGRPLRAFPVTPPGIRVRTTAVRLVKLFTTRPIEQDLKNQSEHFEKHSSRLGYGSDATGHEHCRRPVQPNPYGCRAFSVPQTASYHTSNLVKNATNQFSGINSHHNLG